MNKLKKTLSIVFILSATLATHASLTLSETFNYSNGALGNQAGTGTGTTGNWQLNPDSTGTASAAVVDKTWLSSGITNYTIASSSKALSMPNWANDAAIQLQAPINFDSAGTYYFSFLATRSVDGGGGIVALYDSNAGGTMVDKARLWQGTGGSSWTSSFNAGANGAGTLFSMTSGVDHLFVVRITTVAAGNDTLEVFRTAAGGSIHATDFTSNAGIATASTAVTGSADFLYFWNGNSTSLPLIGELRMGTTYEDVIAVPEPSTYALFVGCAALLIVVYRRRKV